MRRCRTFRGTAPSARRELSELPDTSFRIKINRLHDPAVDIPIMAGDGQRFAFADRFRL